MMGRTHTVAGACSWAVCIELAHPHHTLSADPHLGALALGIPVAAFAATVPDLDRLLGQWAHRKATHSAIGLAVFSGTVLLISGSIRSAAVGPLVLAAIVGYVSHLVTDALTAHGIPLLWPDDRRVYLLPERYRISTGGKRRKHPRWWQQKRGAPVGEVLVMGLSIAAVLLASGAVR